MGESLTAIEPPTTSMFPQRTALRASQRFAAQLRSPAIRTPFQRRFASTESSAFHGADEYVLWNEHWGHWEHMEPLEERPEYPYQNIRTKNFYWGDGDKTVFWNDKVNYHKKSE